MAKPIRNTPILFGKDAENFINQSKKTLSSKEKERECERIAVSLSRFQTLISELNIQ